MTDGKAGCGIWLVIPDVSSEILFQLFVDKQGQRINLTSGIVCPAGSYLSANTGTASTDNLRVLLTGYSC